MVTQTAAISSDTQIQHDVLEELKWDARVAVSNGWVSLTGEVDKQHQREDAERAVGRLVGVRRVTHSGRGRCAPRLMLTLAKERSGRHMTNGSPLRAAIFTKGPSGVDTARGDTLPNGSPLGPD